MIINAGDQILCMRTVHLNLNPDNPLIYYKSGKVYYSEEDNHLTDELGNQHHEWNNLEIFERFFIKIEGKKGRMIKLA